MEKKIPHCSAYFKQLAVQSVCFWHEEMIKAVGIMSSSLCEMTGTPVRVCISQHYIRKKQQAMKQNKAEVLMSYLYFSLHRKEMGREPYLLKILKLDYNWQQFVEWE